MPIKVSSFHYKPDFISLRKLEAQSETAYRIQVIAGIPLRLGMLTPLNPNVKIRLLSNSATLHSCNGIRPQIQHRLQLF